MTSYSIATTVKRVEHRKRVVKGWKNSNGDAVLEEEYIGWFVTLEGFGVAIKIGDDEPDLQVGQQVEVVIRSDFGVLIHPES